MKSGFPYHIIIPAVFISVMVFSSCDNTIQPFEDEDAVLSIYGYFKLSDSTHYIRVRDINQPLEVEATKELDADVTLENLENGNIMSLNGHTELMGELYAHNFPVDKPVQPRTKYRLTAENPDGKKAVSYATTPPFTQAEALQVDEHCTTEVEVIFPEVEKSSRLRTRVGFYYSNNFYSLGYHPEENDDGISSIQFEPQGLINIIFMDEFELWHHPYENPPVRCNELDKDHFRIEYRHYGPEWDGYRIPVSPVESIDVKRGLGFFGAFYDNLYDVPVDTAFVY